MPGVKRFDAMLESVQRDGILEPLTIDLDWVLLDGHHRLAVAKLLGIRAVEVRVWTGTEYVDTDDKRYEPDRVALPDAARVFTVGFVKVYIYSHGDSLPQLVCI